MTWELWPQCAKCSMARGEGVRVPVEEYEVQPPCEAWTPGTPIVVLAKCRHADIHTTLEKGYALRKPEEQIAKLETGPWWGKAHYLAAVKLCVFFKPGEGAPDHGMVTRVS
jgi:hypothetical protein